MSNLKFEEMNLSPEILRAINDMGFEEATPIQSQSIEIIMSGKDIVGQSQTGTGKTAAFGIPLIEMIDADDKRLQALILCPTRELAIQISSELHKLIKYQKNLSILPVYGGQPIERQISALKRGIQIVVGTPGRVMDHIERRTLKPETTRMAVLDEADEMLDMGFREDIEFILNKMPEKRQTIMYSATMPESIMKLTERYLKDPQRIRVAHKQLTVPKIAQVYYEVKEKMKFEALCRLIDLENPSLSLVFCNTKKLADQLAEQLQGRGYFAEALHGDLKQPQRDMVMKKFRDKTINILVATDVAARGLDIDDIDIVFNYDLPQDEEYYIHRIGRTARAGKSGKACTFVVGREIYKLREIMNYTKAKIILNKLPSLSDIEKVKTRQFVDKVKTALSEGNLTKYRSIVEGMMKEDYSAVDVAAALMKLQLFDASEEIDFEINAEPYMEVKPERKRRAVKDGFMREDMVRLCVNAGKKHKIRPKDIVGAFANETGISGNYIGHIDVFDDVTFVDVPKTLVNDIMRGMKGKKIRDAVVSLKIKGEGRKENRLYNLFARPAQGKKTERTKRKQVQKV